MVISAGYLGDFAAGAVIDFHFTAVDPGTLFIPAPLDTSPELRVYHTNDTTPATAGITLSADFNGVTGLNHVRITTATDGTFYAAGRHFTVYVHAGNVSGTTNVGYVVASFSIGARPIQGLATGVITAGSIAADAITDAKVASDVTIASVTGAVGSVTGAVGSVATGGITAASIATGAIDADALAADAVDEILDEVVEGTLTMRQVLRLAIAFFGGKTNGAASTAINFRDSTDAKNRIAMTVDADGDRSAVTLDVS